MSRDESKPQVGVNPRVLIVDDEPSIRRSLEGILRDEGFDAVSAEDGLSAIQQILTEKPSLVLLDIWMPGIDGLETLQRIKNIAADLPVVMISGHAAIATAMKAIQLGASDFIEKPLDMAATVAAVRKALGLSCEFGAQDLKSSGRVDDQSVFDLGRAQGEIQVNPVVFSSQTLRGKRVAQRTLAKSAILYGQGLHSGKKSGLALEPLPPNSGIHFVAVTDTKPVPAHVDNVISTGFATVLQAGRTQFGTIEHLMSALHAYGISNLLIKCNGEVPVLDGSAREFCKLFDDIGTEEQDGEWYTIRVPEKIRVGGDREFIELEPAERYTIDYTIDYPKPVGRHRMVFTLDSIDNYRNEIAPSRTFGLVKDIGYLQKQGYALGGRFDNFVLFGDDGPINDKLRFADEPVRHKILDAIGDLYLLGRPLSAKVTASMTGHSDNVELLKKVRDALRQIA